MKSSQEREGSQGRIRADLIVSVTLVLQVYTNGKELLVKKKKKKKKRVYHEPYSVLPSCLWERRQSLQRSGENRGGCGPSELWKIDQTVSSQRSLLNKTWGCAVSDAAHHPTLTRAHTLALTLPLSSWFVIAASPGSRLVFDWLPYRNVEEVECCHADTSQGQRQKGGKKESDVWRLFILSA